MQKKYIFFNKYNSCWLTFRKLFVCSPPPGIFLDENKFYKSKFTHLNRKSMYPRNYMPTEKQNQKYGSDELY